MHQIDPALRIGSVSLAVSDLPRSSDFYERALGLRVLAREELRATLAPSGEERAALELVQLADPAPLEVNATGLFHVAWLHPSRAALADSVHRVAATGWRFEGASDHGVSEALYLSDPDGLGIELYADRPREQWPRSPDGHGIRMFTAPLDLDSLMAQSDGDPSPEVAPGTTIGHIHLKVSDVGRASAFYRDALGFEELARMPSASFLGAGGYHHHIGLNSWQSAGSAGPSERAPRLLRAQFWLSGAQALEELAVSLERAGAPVRPASEQASAAGDLAVRDPDGSQLVFR